MMDRMVAGFRSPNYKEAGAQMFAAMMGPNLSVEAKERINASFLNTPQHVLVSAMEGMADASIWDEDKINVPVLAIMAKNSFFGLNLEAFYRDVAPELDFQMWEGVGHFIMMEKLKQFNEAVLAFLDQNKLLKKEPQISAHHSRTSVACFPSCGCSDSFVPGDHAPGCMLARSPHTQITLFRCYDVGHFEL